MVQFTQGLKVLHSCHHSYKQTPLDGVINNNNIINANILNVQVDLSDFYHKPLTSFGFNSPS